MKWRGADRDARPPNPRREPLYLRSPANERSAERERALADDDLSELLAATNAKRAARGKAPLSPQAVAARIQDDAAARAEADELRAARDALRAAREVRRGGAAGQPTDAG